MTGLLRSLPDLGPPLGGGSVWTIRDAGIDVALAADIYKEIATGVPSPVASVAREYLAEFSAQRIADVAETEPAKVADMVSAGVARFLEVTAGWSGEQATPWHAGVALDLADLTAFLATDVVLHGYDMGCASGRPWPVDPGHALIGLGACAPILGLIVDPATAGGHSAGYGLAVRGGPSFTVRFTDGA